MNITHSKDGVEIPSEGVPFEFTITRGEETIEQKIVLHDVLVGLNMKVNTEAGRTQSQATSFASYALQKGFETEEEILLAFPAARPIVREGKVECTSWRLISRWEAEIKAERNRKARTTMREAGTEITPGQMTFALSLRDRLRDRGFDALANTLHNLVQVDEETEGPQGATMSAAIERAKNLLDMTEPRKQGQTRPVQVSHTPVPTGETPSEDPF